MKILVIDDDHEEFMLIEKALKSAGYQSIQYASSGEEGVEKVKIGDVVVVVTDTVMHGMDGFETCQKIKEIESRRIKVIILTGQVDAVDAGKARQVGADDYCVKTSDYELLINALKGLGNSV